MEYGGSAQGGPVSSGSWLLSSGVASIRLDGIFNQAPISQPYVFKRDPNGRRLKGLLVIVNFHTRGTAEEDAAKWERFKIMMRCRILEKEFENS